MTTTQDSKWLPYALVAGALAIAFAFFSAEGAVYHLTHSISDPIRTAYPSDWRAYHRASEVMFFSLGDGLYDPSVYVKDNGDYLPFLASPLVAALLTPLGLLSPVGSYTLLLITSTLLVTHRVVQDARDRHQRSLAFLLVTAGLVPGLLMGQITPFLIALALLGPFGLVGMTLIKPTVGIPFLLADMFRRPRLGHLFGVLVAALSVTLLLVTPEWADAITAAKTSVAVFGTEVVNVGTMTNPSQVAIRTLCALICVFLRFRLRLPSILGTGLAFMMPWMFVYDLATIFFVGLACDLLARRSPEREADSIEVSVTPA